MTAGVHTATKNTKTRQTKPTGSNSKSDFRNLSINYI